MSRTSAHEVRFQPRSLGTSEFQPWPAHDIAYHLRQEATGVRARVYHYRGTRKRLQ